VTVSLETARELLDLGARLRDPSQPNSEPPRAVEQLQGAVAIHNILERQGIAYLADEVGMGKTYVALGAIALFRHYQPSFRVAVVAPRENIQLKWIKEWTNFATHIVRIPDLRMKALHGGPARSLVGCASLRHFVRETTLDSERDFFLRLSSFSLATGDEEAELAETRRKFRKELPWLDDEILSLRSKKEFKDNLAKALCCAIPKFDLLVIDEAHNLKHGFSDRIAARNRVIAFMFGRDSQEVDRQKFPDYGNRASKVLFLSATPIEDDYRQLWNQLDVFGRGGPYHDLTKSTVSEEAKKQIVRRFLIRGVTTLKSGDERLTKNLYRREWRRGGLVCHDEPICVNDPRQRLVVALVQKKVAELLNSPAFNATFQMGMLASFESFLETAKLKKRDDERGNFDNVEQTQDELEREGIDVHTINKLAKDFRLKFGRELPHPKMDALALRLSQAWVTGRKALVFLRRVASVWELKERLDIEYNSWLANRLRSAFAPSRQMIQELETLLTSYERARGDRRALLAAREGSDARGQDEEQDRGGVDTLFAWFFRGEGPSGNWLSGAKFSQRFGQRRYALSTFFEDNYAATLLKCEPGQVFASLAQALGGAASQAEELVSRIAGRYMSKAKRPGRGDLFEAAQAAAVEILRESASDPELRHQADVVWSRRFEFRRQSEAFDLGSSVLRYLETPTFFTALKQARWQELRNCLWPSSHSRVFCDEVFVEQELRRELLSTSARLGHATIDLYTLAMMMRGSMRTKDQRDDSGDLDDVKLAEQYLEHLELQRMTALPSRGWGAFDELAEIGAHFELIIDVNEPRARSSALAGVGRMFGALLRQQQPVGGMTGQVSKTLVRQFRMPGYPLVLLSTDLLQEGEDLHTFCADIYHYGLAWTPSAVEQRIGRIDRVRSKTERTAGESNIGLSDETKLQVYFPHLEDTVERLQVRRVLKRMQEFTRLMHEGLSAGKEESSRLNVAAELLDSKELPAPISTPLETAFPVLPEHLRGHKRPLDVTAAQSRGFVQRLNSLREMPLAELRVTWEPQVDDHAVHGTVSLTSGRFQPFALHLKSFGERLVVRCVSPVGRLDKKTDLEGMVELSRKIPAQLGIIEGADDRGADLTVEEEVLLGAPLYDQSRVAWLVRRVALNADNLEHELCSGRDATFKEVSEFLRAEGKVLGHDA